jgi:hypothetical protein
MAAGLDPSHNRREKSNLIDKKTQRIFDWNSNVLARLLTQVIARWRACGISPNRLLAMFVAHAEGEIVIDEVVEIIEVPQFADAAAHNQIDTNKIDLGPIIFGQWEDYITTLSTLYHDNPFHNFEHASHVAMSVGKLLSRIIAPNYIELNDSDSDSGHNVASSLHDNTYGITLDPLKQFACIFASLIHDVDHQGVPNAQLIKEEASVALTYNGKSVTEQNSVDLAWDLLMKPKFEHFRAALCCNDHVAQPAFRQRMQSY